MNKKTLLNLSIAVVVGVLVGLFISKTTNSMEASSGPAENGKDAVSQSHQALGDSFVQATSVMSEPLIEKLSINGKLALNGLSVYQISSRIPGRIDRISMLEGGSVKAGQAIAWLYSPEFMSAQYEYLLARRAMQALNHPATEDLHQDAKATLEGARNKLRILGASSADFTYLDERGVAQEHLAITSPISGRITKRTVDPGGYLDAGASLGVVADMSNLWFVGNVFETNLSQLHEGQAATVTVNGSGAPSSLKGRIGFVSPMVDPQTHTVTVRVDIPNPSGLLKPEMFARADIELGVRSLPVVPRSAVVQDGAESFVVVQRDNKEFHRVSVMTIPANKADEVAITRGIQEGDRVVTEGGVLVDRAIINASKAKASMPAAEQQVKP